MTQTQLEQLPIPLLLWYRDNARVLPWRSDPTPYGVWVSEIMLQQTRVDGVELSCCQFFFVTAFSLIGSLLFEHPTWAGLTMAAGAILYAGLLSSGVGYTLQILAQKGSNPTVISLLLSLESVFATISGAAILGDRLSGREYFGCALMLAAVVLAQLPDRKKA